MTTASSFVSFSRRHSLLWRHSLWICSQIVASVLFSFAFACALPLAAFATIAALTAARREAFVLIGAIWFANQAVGFMFMHYPTDAVTLAWGGALGIIAVLSCEAAGLVARRSSGLAGAGLAFVAAFVIYESSILAITAATGPGADHFTAATVSWIFFVNACAFVGLLALKAVGAAAEPDRAEAGLVPRVTLEGRSDGRPANVAFDTRRCTRASSNNHRLARSSSCNSVA